MMGDRVTSLWLKAEKLCAMGIELRTLVEHNRMVSPFQLPRYGGVYVVKGLYWDAEGLWKIGRTVDWRLRYRQLSNYVDAMPTGLIGSHGYSDMLERILHIIFWRERRLMQLPGGSEWFDLAKDDVSWLSGLDYINMAGVLQDATVTIRYALR